jgi:ribosomal protein S7
MLLPVCMNKLDFDSFEAWQRAESLAHTARKFISEGQLEKAKSIWDEAVEIARKGENSSSLQDSIDSSSVLWEISEDMASAGEFGLAEEIAVAIKNERKRQNALHNIAEIAEGKEDSFSKGRGK